MVLPVLHTARLTLIPVGENDVDRLLEIFNQPEVRRFLFDDAEVNREIVNGIVSHALDQVATGCGLWGAVINEELIGCAGLMPTTAVAASEPRLSGMIEPIVALDPTRWGQGYATECLDALIGYARNQLHLPRLAGAADVPNEASHRMLERCGFRRFSEVAGPAYRLRTYLLELGDSS